MKNVIPCANGTDALQIAFMALDLKPGDEIICPSWTYIATAEAAAILGIKIVFCDVDLDTFNTTADLIEPHINDKTKAIVPVHLYGQCCDMAPIIKLAEKHKLKIIEDNAQAIGSAYQFRSGKKVKTGTIGDVGTTSFFPSKNLGCFGDGGAIFTNDDDLAHTLRGIVNHGMYKRYHHDVVGVNSRLDSIQAAVLNAKLPYLDSYNKARQNAARHYTSALKNNKGLLTPMAGYQCSQICENCDCHVFHQYTIRILNDKRDGLAKQLSNSNIPHGIYYPIPLHRQKAYLDSRYNEKDFSNTNLLCKQVISLPMHSELELDQINFICKKINAFLKFGSCN